MDFDLWHYEIDALPRLEPVNPGNPHADFTLYVPIGIYPKVAFPWDIISYPAPDRLWTVDIEFSINGGPLRRISSAGRTADGRISFISPEYVGLLRRTQPRLARPYLDIEDQIVGRKVLYAEGMIPNVPYGSRIQYAATATFDGGPPVHTLKYSFFATMPQFGQDDICYIAGSDNLEVDGCIVYHRDDAKFHHFRCDYVTIRDNRPRFELLVNGQRFTLEDNPVSGWLPLINQFHDYVTLSLPKHDFPTITNLVWRKNTNIDLGQKGKFHPVRIMFINFCTQALNDLFELPNSSYKQPRTYMQITMRDELGVYCSRPGAVDIGSGPGEGDGYSFALQNHDLYQIKYLWTFNGGVLSLMAHDCPDDLKKIKGYITSGRMDPAIAGFGGHALPYYREETNTYSIGYGIEIMENILGAVGSVYYLDQRLYRQYPAVINALKADESIKYIVTDGSTGFTPHQETAVPTVKSDVWSMGWHYLWRDKQSGLYVLYIDDEMRNKMVGSDDYEYRRGKLSRDLRMKFMLFASKPDVYEKHLLIYGDDADKASGNGWFDGEYAGLEIDFTDRYGAALEWIADHPWIEAVSSGDLDPAKDCVGTIDMRDAISEPIDPGGSASRDQYGATIHFDAWYENWKAFRSHWLDQPLGEISRGVEYAIIDMPPRYRNELHTMAELTFSMALQESQWNKQPVEYIDGRSANDRHDVCEPEDFAIAASLQIRNAQVYANAAVWAEWARAGDTATYCNDGPVIDTIRGLRYGKRADGNDAKFSETLIDSGGSGLRWDRDLLENVILYNSSVLVVMDQNGGRITHIFFVKDGHPYCVSGTMKTYQYLTSHERNGESVSCDGEVLQNTVYTPNHAYIACDVRESAGVVGLKYSPRTNARGDFPCFYPDNFNSYDFEKVGATTVHWTYTSTAARMKEDITIGELRDLLREDRLVRRDDGAGRRNGAGGVTHHPFPGFSKRIRLVGRTLTIEYSGARPGHVVANEFSVDLYRQLMFAEWHRREARGKGCIEFACARGPVKATIAITTNCKFSAETRQGDNNLRLHRVLTDCVEIVAPKGGDFSYEIRIE